MLKLTGHSFVTLSVKQNAFLLIKCTWQNLHAFNSVRILDCYSDPLGWKQKIQNQQHRGNSAKQFSTNKEIITVFRSVKDVTKLMSSTTELGGGIIYHKASDLLISLCFCPNRNLLMLWMSGFEGEGKTYFSVAVDSVRTNYFSLTFLWVETILAVQIMYSNFVSPIDKTGVPTEINIIHWRLFHHPCLIVYGTNLTNAACGSMRLWEFIKQKM